jgi:hypothetical protein
MAATANDELRALLQEFVDARLDAPELFARAGKLLPEGSDPYEEILELLAEANLQLRLPPGRQAFIRRLEQFARGETSYTELDLWCFSLGQTEALSPDAAVSSDPEVKLLRALVDWIDQWEDEVVRPQLDEVRELARILAQEADPARCLEALEEALARFGRD